MTGNKKGRRTLFEKETTAACRLPNHYLYNCSISFPSLTYNVPGANICTSDYGPTPTFFLTEGFFRTLNMSPPTPSRMIFRMIYYRMICFFWHHRHYVNTPPWWQICWCWCPNSSTRPQRFSFLLSCPWLFCLLKNE